MTTKACASRLSPAAGRRMLLAAVALAAAIIGNAWLRTAEASGFAGAGLELLGLAASAWILAPIARIRWLPWATAAVVGSAIVGLTLIPGFRSSGGLPLAMLLSALAPSGRVGLATALVLVAAEAVATLI